MHVTLCTDGTDGSAGGVADRLRVLLFEELQAYKHLRRVLKEQCKERLEATMPVPSPPTGARVSLALGRNLDGQMGAIFIFKEALSAETLPAVTLPAGGGADASARFEGHLACPPSAAYLCNMAVAGAHRGRGVAKALLSACDDLAGEMGFGEVYLHVREGDEVAYGLYEKRGYEAVARESAWKRAFAGTGGGVALMKKKL